MTDVCAELATYLNLIEGENMPFSTLRYRLESCRRLNNLAKQVNVWLKYLSQEQLHRKKIDWKLVGFGIMTALLSNLAILTLWFVSRTNMGIG